MMQIIKHSHFGVSELPARWPWAEAMLREIFESADIRIGGGRPWDIQVHNDRFYRRVLADGLLGFGEAYMEGWWDCDAIDEMCFRAKRANLEKHWGSNVRVLMAVALSAVINLQSKSRSRLVGERHYDLGNDFFEAMLGPTMQYSCAYFQNTADLDEAQRLKMDLICRKLDLRPGMRLLDIGCGWGGLAKYAAQRYGCTVIGITISKQQQSYGEEFCRGLPVEIRLQDYRDVSEPFDRIVSVGMLEHVGYKNYRHYMKAADRCLKDDGLFLCHTIADIESIPRPDPWISEYIFPNSILPSASLVARAAEGLFVLEDTHNFGAYYDPTLLAWENRFRKSWQRFENRFGGRFYRMWRYYLLGCAGAFRARGIQLYQFVFSKGGLVHGYVPIRAC
ncbi:MAG: cyclopropane fatty acyl phospholipid synthase [Methylacidiphilales bacterium]|nr:cyclopropane fatty acyl phospholipid synthase [Candidatus Methylacidiphilales bacterium]